MPTVNVFDVEMFDFVVVAESDGCKDKLSLERCGESAVQRPHALLSADHVHST